MNAPLAIQNSRNLALVNAKVPSDGCLALRTLHGEDGVDVVFGKLSAKSRMLKADVGGMVVVINPCGPFKVGSDVIGLEPVNVVDLRHVEWIGDKSQSNKSMNADVAESLSSPEVDADVASTSNSHFHDFSEPPHNAVASNSAKAVQASDPTKAADFVKASEGWNRYGSPFFIHGTDLPNVIDASTMASNEDQYIGDFLCR